MTIVGAVGVALVLFYVLSTRCPAAFRRPPLPSFFAPMLLFFPASPNHEDWERRPFIHAGFIGFWEACGAELGLAKLVKCAGSSGGFVEALTVRYELVGARV